MHRVKKFHVPNVYMYSGICALLGIWGFVAAYAFIAWMFTESLLFFLNCVIWMQG